MMLSWVALVALAVLGWERGRRPVLGEPAGGKGRLLPRDEEAAVIK